jgi:hypothetical protein
MACCDRENDQEHDDDVERCFSGKGRRCMCLPYDDGFMITAQILSAVAFCVSWIFWGSFIICLGALVAHQVIWCMRQSKSGLIAAQVVSFLASISCIAVGVWVWIYRRNSFWCVPFTLISDDDDYVYEDDDDWCPERAYASVAWVSAALWLAAAGFTFAFMCTGRHAKWEAKHNTQAEATAIEMGNVESAPAAATAAAVTPVEVSSMTFVPPEAKAKVDEAETTEEATAEAVGAPAYVPPEVNAVVEDGKIPAEAASTPAYVPPEVNAVVEDGIVPAEAASTPAYVPPEVNAVVNDAEAPAEVANLKSDDA